MTTRKPSAAPARYRCKHCGKIVSRDGGKAWINSYCEQTGRDTRLVRIKKGGAK